MALFDKIRKILRGGGALPHEHGPRASIARHADGRFIVDGGSCSCGGNCACGQDKSPIYKFKTTPATTDDKPGTIPQAVSAEQLDAYLDKIMSEAVAKPARKPRSPKLDQVKADSERMAKQKASLEKSKASAPETKKPVSKSQAKRVAIQKDVADTPVATPKKKAPAKKVTKPVSKDAPKAQAKPSAKKASPKKGK